MSCQGRASDFDSVRLRIRCNWSGDPAESAEGNEMPQQVKGGGNASD